MNPPRIAATLLLCTCAAFAASDWRPVDPADLASKTPKVDPAADAEALFWDVRVLDEFDSSEIHTVLTHYIRIKIFTEHGKERNGKVDIASAGRTKISDIAARTIKPDGSVMELEKNAIFDRVIMQGDGFKVRAKSFAMPGVEPGAIIEYRWRETRQDQLANYVRLQFQRDIPIQSVTYHIKPLSHPAFPFGMRSLRFQCPNSPFVKEMNGYVATTVENVPAFHREPYMPPEDQVRSWMLIYYSRDYKLEGDKFWQEFGRETYRNTKPQIKVDGEVKSSAAHVIEDASTDDEKLKRLFEFCRRSIKNVRDAGSGLTAEDRAALKPNKQPSDTLKQGAGTSLDIDLLFASLATAAGFEARFARLGDRGDTWFDRRFGDPYFLGTYNVAVRVKDQWRFFDPASKRVPYGMLRWQEEGEDVLISDPKEPVFAKTPLAGPEQSLSKRQATFKLTTNGDLEGDVTVQYTGHSAIARRSQFTGDTPEQQTSELRGEMKARLGTGAAASKVKIENLEDPDKPLIESFHIRVPGYAQRTGKRLFVPVAFFQRGYQARFPTSDRVHPLYFHFPWSEQDSVSIDVPEGYDLDNADAPQPLTFNPVGEYGVRIGVTKDHRTLIYTRTFVFGRNGNLVYPLKSYASLKKIFDAIYERDEHMITLKQPEGAN